MEENLVLKVVIEDDKQIAIHMGDSADAISPATLIGILEQIKMSVFDSMKVEKVIKSNQNYDA